jgi:hypothetical protein
MSLSKEFIDYMNTANPKLAAALTKGFEENRKIAETNSKTNMYKKSSAVFGEFIKKAQVVEEAERTPSPISFNFLPSDKHIKDEMFKLAGMAVYDTSPEGIEQFLKEYMLNELSFFPDKVDLTIGIMPLDNVPTNNGTGQLDTNIMNASGTLDLMYGGSLIQIPWIMRDKEILPFDTIQLGTETAVYTRENLRNILFNIKNMVEKQQTAGTIADPEISGYVGTSKPMGRLTDNGFMTDMLHIQGLMSSVGNGAYAYAAEKIDDLLEKVANIKEVRIDYRKLKTELVNEFQEAAEKIANEAYDEPESSTLEKQALFDTLEKKVLSDVRILDNEAKFSFTEKDGMIVSEVQAAIFKTLTSVCGVDVDSNMIITSDGRFKILRPGERFMFNLVKDENIADFEFKTRSLDALNSGYVYTANIGGTYFLPFAVTKVVSGATHALNIKKFYFCIDIRGNEFVIIPAINVSENQMCLQSKKDIMGQVAKTEEPKKLLRYNLILRDHLPILCLSPKTKLIQLRAGTISNIESAKDAMFLYDGNVKLASFTNNIVVTLVSGEGDPKFNLEARWFDRKQNRDRKLSFSNLAEPKLKGILKTMGFDYNKVSEITYRAKKEHSATYELGAGTTPWLVKPEVTAQMAAENTIKNMRQSFFTQENAKKAVAGVLGGLIGGAVAGTTLGDTVSDFGKFASESAALAEKLEKIAIAKENKTFTKLAGLMVIKNKIDNMLANAYTGAEFQGTEVLAELRELDPYLEKVARDLVELKFEQAMFKDEIVSPNVIVATLRHLNDLYKYACTFSISKDASLTGATYDTFNKETEAAKNGIRNTVVEEKPSTPGKKAPGLIGTAAEFALTGPGLVGAMFAPKLFKKFTKGK